MLFRAFKIAALLSIFCTALPAFAEPNCTCRYKGKDIAEGGTICAQLPSGPVLMQCGRVLNNTAWKTLQKGCPYARYAPHNHISGQR